MAWRTILPSTLMLVLTACPGDPRPKGDSPATFEGTWETAWNPGYTEPEVCVRVPTSLPAAVRQTKYRVTKRLRRDLEDFS